MQTTFFCFVSISSFIGHVLKKFDWIVTYINNLSYNVLMLIVYIKTQSVNWT